MYGVGTLGKGVNSLSGWDGVEWLQISSCYSERYAIKTWIVYHLQRPFLFINCRGHTICQALVIDAENVIVGITAGSPALLVIILLYSNEGTVNEILKKYIQTSVNEKNYLHWHFTCIDWETIHTTTKGWN